MTDLIERLVDVVNWLNDNDDFDLAADVEKAITALREYEQALERLGPSEFFININDYKDLAVHLEDEFSARQEFAYTELNRIRGNDE